MKKLYATLAILLIGTGLSAQCGVQLSGTDVWCFGGCNSSLTAYPINTVGPVSYLWMPGGQTTQTITGLCAGTYTVSITDSIGCNVTSQWIVTEPPQLQVYISNVVNPSCQTCCDGSMDGNASGGTPNYSWQWFPTSVWSWQLQNACAGTYTFCVTDQNGCYSCDTVSISFPTAIDNPIAQDQMSLLPAADHTFLLMADFGTPASGEIIITNMVGEIVHRENFADKTLLNTEINLGNQPSGMYFVSIVSGNGIITRRIIRN